MNEKKKRPVAITVICILGFLAVAISIPVIFSDYAADVGDWYQPFALCNVLIVLAAMVGLWKMKRWAVYTYTGVVAVSQIVLLSMEVWAPMSLIVPAMVIATAFAHIGKMD